MSALSLPGIPFPFGLTFIPAAVLAEVAPGASSPADALSSAAASVDASFAFVPAVEAWAEEAMVALGDAGVAPMWAVSGPLWPIIEARGALEGLRDTLTHPEEVGAELDTHLDALLLEVGRGVRLGARAIVLAEDLAGSAGPLIAPDFAIAELLPRYMRIVRSARSLGVPAIFHSDGDLRPLLPAIARAGFAGVHAGGGLDFEAFDRLFWAARAADLAVLGGMLTPELANAARAEHIGSSIGVLAKAGGLFVADDGGITTAGELREMLAALEAARAV